MSQRQHAPTLALTGPNRAMTMTRINGTHYHFAFLQPQPPGRQGSSTRPEDEDPRFLFTPNRPETEKRRANLAQHLQAVQTWEKALETMKHRLTTAAPSTIKSQLSEAKQVLLPRLGDAAPNPPRVAASVASCNKTLPLGATATTGADRISYPPSPVAGVGLPSTAVPACDANADRTRHQTGHDPSLAKLPRQTVNVEPRCGSSYNRRPQDAGVNWSLHSRPGTGRPLSPRLSSVTTETNELQISLSGGGMEFDPRGRVDSDANNGDARTVDSTSRTSINGPAQHPKTDDAPIFQTLVDQRIGDLPVEGCLWRDRGETNDRCVTPPVATALSRATEVTTSPLQYDHNRIERLQRADVRARLRRRWQRLNGQRAKAGKQTRLP